MKKEINLRVKNIEKQVSDMSKGKVDQTIVAESDDSDDERPSVSRMEISSSSSGSEASGEE